MLFIYFDCCYTSRINFNVEVDLTLYAQMVTFHDSMFLISAYILRLQEMQLKF